MRESEEGPELSAASTSEPCVSLVTCEKQCVAAERETDS